MNLLEADRLAEFSQELRRYYVTDRYKSGYVLCYHGINESYFVYNGEYIMMIGFIAPIEKISKPTEAEAWEQLPEDLKALRAQWQ